MAVTIYTHHDAAGPGLNLTGNNLAKLLQILVPCLVNGYAGKAAAGWTLAQNISNGFTLARPSGAAVNFTRTQQYGLMLYLMESLTSGAASPPTGQNLRSLAYSASSNPGETSRHWFYFLDSVAVKSWFVAATADAFLLHVRFTDAVSDTSYQTSFTLFIGAAKLYSGLTGVQNMFALTGTSQPVTYVSNGISNNVFCVGYTALRDPLTGAAITGAGLEVYAAPYNMQQFATYYSPLPSALPPVLRLQPLHMTYGGGFVGLVPGVLFDNILGHYAPDAVMSALGFTPSVEAWKSPKVINGQNVWPIPTVWGLLFVTDDPGAW